jgi:Ser/Thr protein kinase RdoA (MazF antagonist)
MERQIAKILAKYGIEDARLLPARKGYRNTSYPIRTAAGMFNLIIYKREPQILDRIKNANRVGDFLAAQGLPTRRTLDPRILQLKAGERLVYASLYQYMPGQTIPWEAYTKDHIKALGGAMGEMHNLLRSYPAHDMPLITDELLALASRMRHYFADPNVRRAMAVKLNLRLADHNFEPLLRATTKLPNQQVLHMDFVRGNILFEAKTITGILDFEKTAVGHPIFDIARTLAFLLIDCKYKDAVKVRKYFLRSGYIKRGRGAIPKITLQQNDLLEVLVDFFLLHDFYKFLRHNPYESLASNEHFVRTAALLLDRKRVTKIG